MIIKISSKGEEMSIGKLFNREVVTAPRDMSVNQAAKLMKNHKIGDIVVIDEEHEGMPVGIFTDRDIAVKIVAEEVDPINFCVGDAMSEALLVLEERLGVKEAVELMCVKGIRRAPIINREGSIIGIISIDDLILLLADELGTIAKLIGKQILR
jgi:CBS domain-containing protein